MGSHRDDDRKGASKVKKDKHKKDKDKSTSKKDKKRRSKEGRKDRAKPSKHDRRRDASSSSGSSDSSGSESDDPGLLNPRQRLQRERQAVNVLRDLMWTHGSARKDLRELLWTLDQGKAANISGVPDEQLRSQLQQLFKLLGLARAATKGSWVLRTGQPTTLSVLGFVFDEQPRPPVVRAPAPQPAPAPAPSAAPATASPPTHAATASRQPAASPSRSASPPRPAGVSVALGVAQRTSTSPEPTSEDGAPGAGGARVRVVGPAIPSEAMLAAAAQAAAELAERGSDEGSPGPGVVSEDSDDGAFVIGPVPPELQEEVDAVPEDAREAEILRIIKLLREAALEPSAAGAAAKPPASSGPPGSSVAVSRAYDVLGVPHDVSTGDVKKRYMRLSLMVHPDKCKHKDAHEAFQAVTAAAKALQDSGARAAVDAAREDAELRRLAKEAAAKLERDKAWAAVRGGEVPAALKEMEATAAAAAAAALVRPTRDSWMTDLPPEHQVALGGDIMSQVSQRSFNRFGVKPRGDTRAWTDTPQQKADRAAGKLPDGPMLLTSGSGQGASGTSTADAELLAAYNSKARKKSLLEQHMETPQTGPTPKKPKGDGADNKAAAGPIAASTGHPWRPFDRERDLELKPKALDPTKLLKQQGALNSRFASAGATRKFL